MTELLPGCEACVIWPGGRAISPGSFINLFVDTTHSLASATGVCYASVARAAQRDPPPEVGAANFFFSLFLFPMKTVTGGFAREAERVSNCRV